MAEPEGPENEHLDGPTIAALVASADRGDGAAAEQLFTTLYRELHRLARHELARRSQVSLGVTTLLHEAYLNMSGREGVAFPDRARFMGYASRVMRGLIISHIRNRGARKRGSDFEITAFETDNALHQGVDQTAEAVKLEQLGDALNELAQVEPLLAELVDLKFFCGFSFIEIATMRGVSERTVQRDWQRARIHLHYQLRPEDPLE